MCSLESFDIITNLEDMLMCDSLDPSCPSGIKVYKVSRDHKEADYICYASNRQCAPQISKVWESKCIEKMPWMKDYMEVTVAPHGFNISLSRNLCFHRGLEAVGDTNKLFGHNTLFADKTFELSIAETRDPTSLTSLRMDLVNEVITNIIRSCGGVLQSDKQSIKILTTNKNKATDGSIVLFVGPVMCQSTDKKSKIDSNMYKRLRLKDISLMCEHKLDVNDRMTFEDRNKLLKATIMFDVLQSSFWRSVTLHVLDGGKDVKSSCKGAMFVLYNYARLYTLCNKFDEHVSSGVYPSLPSLSEIDFTLLTQDEEWKLMLLSILSWPSVLQNSVVDLMSGRPKIHLIFEFLKVTATNFSHYYHRVRIFTEPRSHLLPVLFARMHLLKGLLKIMQFALQISSISPLNRM